MKKSSFFLGGALLLVSLFTTSCKEVMSNLDQPVSSYLEVNKTDVVLNLDTVYQIEIKSNINSDNPVTFKSSDETIATVDANGLVTPVGNKEGDIEITVAVAASPYYQAGEQKVKIAVKQPLTFEALEDGQIYLNYYNGITLEKPIVVTTNRTTKKEYTSSNYITVKKGDKLQFESANDHTATGTSTNVRITPQSKCAVYGNVMSMISPDGNYHTNKTITKDYALARLLYGNRTWKDDHYEYYTMQHEKYNLMVPATNLKPYCYYYLFYNTGITKVPELPATEIPDYGYSYMFSSCGELTEAPAISVKSLGSRALYYMFRSCSKLTKANAITVQKEAGNSAFNRMFYYCAELTEAPAISAESLGSNACEYMFGYCPKLTKANAITVQKEAGYCAFYYMFSSCVELKESPAISAESLGNYTCYYMFNNCPKLTKANPITIKKATGSNAFYYMFNSCVELKESPAITAETLGEYACQNMFNNCQKLEKANAINVKEVGSNALRSLFANKPELKEAVAVNAEKLGDYACYQMFNSCPMLEKAPATLPAETLADHCYSDMFAGCTKLEKAPALPAMELKPYCYNYMFGGCSSLTEAPELKAATLAYGSYCAMFMSCSKLSNVTCLATTNAVDALGMWLSGAGTSVTTPTLKKAAANNNWELHDAWDYPWGGEPKWYVPTGWTIADAE